MSYRFWRGRYWGSLKERVWGPVKEWNSSLNGEVMEGIDDGCTSLSSVLSSQEGGVCTLVFDCLVRYQNAAMMETCVNGKSD